MGLIKWICGYGRDCSHILQDHLGLVQASAEAGRIGQVCLQELMGLVRKICRNRQDWPNLLWDVVE